MRVGQDLLARTSCGGGGGGGGCSGIPEQRQSRLLGAAELVRRFLGPNERNLQPCCGVRGPVVVYTEEEPPIVYRLIALALSRPGHRGRCRLGTRKTTSQGDPSSPPPNLTAGPIARYASLTLKEVKKRAQLCGFFMEGLRNENADCLYDLGQMFSSVRELAFFFFLAI